MMHVVVLQLGIVQKNHRWGLLKITHILTHVNSLEWRSHYANGSCSGAPTFVEGMPLLIKWEEHNEVAVANESFQLGGNACQLQSFIFDVVGKMEFRL